MCECSSIQSDYVLKRLLQKQSGFGWCDLILRRPLRENSRFQIHIWFLLRYPIRPRWPRPPITVSQVAHRWFWGHSIRRIFRYHPTQSELFIPFPHVIFSKDCRIPKFRRRRNSDELTPRIQILLPISMKSIILFGVTVETSWPQSGKTLMPVRLLSQSFISCLWWGIILQIIIRSFVL